MKLLLLALLLFTCSPKASAREIILSKDHHFLWPLPASWEQKKMDVPAQYVVQVKGSQGAFTAFLLVSPSRFTLSELIKDQKYDPRVFFDNAILPQFPGSKFLRSSVSKFGSQDALLTEYLHVTQNLDSVRTIHCLALVTVWKEKHYIMTFMCSPKDFEFGKALFQSLMEGFIFG